MPKVFTRAYSRWAKGPEGDGGNTVASRIWKGEMRMKLFEKAPLQENGAVFFSMLAAALSSNTLPA